MKSKKLALIIITFLVTSSLSFSQKEWTLEECINYALENNISVKRQELSALTAEKNHFQSYMELLPDLNANGQHYYNAGKAINYDTYEYADQNFQGGSVSLYSEITLFSGLQNFNSIKKSKYDLMSQLESVEKIKNDITLNIATAYLQILLNIELKDNAEKQLNITLEQIEKTKRLVEIGNAAKGDLLQIEAQAAMEKASLIDATNNLKISYLTLSQLLNLDSSEDFAIVIPIITDITLDGEIKSVNNIFNEAIGLLPEIKGAEYNVESSVKNVAISKGLLSPTLTFGYQYSSRYNELSNKLDSISAIGKYYYADSYPYLDQIRDNASHAVMLNLRIPIFNRWRNKNRIDQAKITLSDSKLNLDLQKQNLYKNIQQARAQAIAALNRYQANLEAVESMEEAFRYTEQKYQVGLVDILEYKTAKNNLNKTKSDLAQAKYEYIFKTKILEFYQGEQITL